MKYKQLTDKVKAQIDILLDTGFSMREAGRKLNISHSTISRYKNGVYTKRTIDIHQKYAHFIDYLHQKYNPQHHSIDICVLNYRRYHPHKPCVSAQQVYNWINQDKLQIKPQRMCYKRRKKKRRANGMMNHLIWNIANKTVLPISLRPKEANERQELGHLEIDSIIGKRNEYVSIISVVDRCSRVVHLIKSENNNEYSTMWLIHDYLITNKIQVKSITVDNGKEFSSMGIIAKRLGVKLYKCDPYCSFQRGSNEHINGIVRRYIPKGKSLHNYAQQYLDNIAYKINSMPRKLFDFKTAYQVEFIKTQSGAVEI